MFALIRLVDLLFDAYILMIIVRVILSWINVDPRQPIVAFLDRVTDPILNPIRNLIGTAGPIDFSPLVAVIILSVLRTGIIRLLVMST